MMLQRYAVSVLTAVACVCGGTLAWADTLCTGALTGDIAGNVVVPKNASCTLTQINVSGSVLVSNGASLAIDARQYPSMVSGDVEAAHCGSTMLKRAVTVGGAVPINTLPR